MSHDSCRNVERFKNVGQNLVYRAKSLAFEKLPSFINNSINMWFNEIQYAYPADIDTCCGGTRFSKIGHFLQLMQEKITAVGCAIAKYTNGNWKTLLLACNYSASNLKGSRVYMTGESGSNCTDKGTSVRYRYLCN